MITWEQDSFAFAESLDEESGRYRGLRSGERIGLSEASAPGLLVRPEVARQQIDADVPTSPGDNLKPRLAPSGTDGTAVGSETGHTEPDPQPPTLKRFHGAVTLDATRVGRDASQIADEVIAHLAGDVGANVTVTLEIQAEIPNGAPDHVVRTVTENSRTRNFTNQGLRTRVDA